MTRIILTFNPFKWNDIESYLSLFIRWTLYFKQRGLNGSDTKYNHVLAIVDGTAYEAKLTYKSYLFIGKTSKHIILTPNFNFDEKVFEAVLSEMIGLRYNFWAIMCQLVYQVFGFKIQKRFYRPFCSQSTAKAFYYATIKCNTDIAKNFKNYNYIDPQDFVRMWKANLFIN